MLLRPISSLLIAASAATAFKDAHPMLILADGSLEPGRQSRQLATAAQVQGILHIAPEEKDLCHVQIQVFEQPGLTAADFQHMPKLRSRSETVSSSQSVVQIAEVIGEVDVEKSRSQLELLCGLGDFEEGWQMGVTSFQPLATEGRKRVEELAKLDKHMHQYLSKTAKAPYVVLFTGAETNGKGRVVEDHQDLPYEMDEPYPSPLKTDLKRDIELHKRNVRARQSNSTDNTQANLPLFEKYQFLSPPIFMGLAVFILLGSILYAGISAIAGLEVSYAAFSKEMGPQAQNKGKQQ